MCNGTIMDKLISFSLPLIINFEAVSSKYLLIDIFYSSPLFMCLTLLYILENHFPTLLPIS